MCGDCVGRGEIEGQRGVYEKDEMYREGRR